MGSSPLLDSSGLREDDFEGLYEISNTMNLQTNSTSSAASAPFNNRVNHAQHALNVYPMMNNTGYNNIGSHTSSSANNWVQTTNTVRMSIYFTNCHNIVLESQYRTESESRFTECYPQ